jgi:spore maturation protein CgeB
LQKQIEEQYKIKTAFLPFGFELSEAEYAAVESAPEIHKICFIGNPGKTRINTIRYLATSGFEVDVYGHGWNQTALKKIKNVNIFDAVYGQEFWKKLRQYRVQLNIFRKHNVGSHNMRSFEIPAIGGIQLAPYSAELADLFTEGKEIFFYRNDEDLLKQAIKLISAPSASIEEYRQAARDRSMTSSYSYRDRAITVYENLKILTGQ